MIIKYFDSPEELNYFVECNTPIKIISITSNYNDGYKIHNFVLFYE